MSEKGMGLILLKYKHIDIRGHSMSDPAKYRTKEELDNYKQTDPIEIVKAGNFKEKNCN